MRLLLFAHLDGVRVGRTNTVVYDLAGDRAHLAPAAVEGHALVWQLGDGDALGTTDTPVLCAEVELDPGTAWILRCDRVDFAPGGVAHRHTHPGPGIRCLLFGQITIETPGTEHTYGPGQAWFERAGEPVRATSAASEPTAFVRVLLLPAELAGQRTIRYVDPADTEKPKTQRAKIFLEAPLRA